MLQHTRKGRRTFLSPLMIYDLSLDAGFLIEFSERRRTTAITHVLRVPNDRCIACYDDLTTTACVFKPLVGLSFVLWLGKQIKT